MIGEFLTCTQSQISVILTINSRVAYTDLVSLAASVISAEQQPDPDEQGLFDSSRQPRRRTYLQLGGNATWVFLVFFILLYCVADVLFRYYTLVVDRSFSVGDSSRALVHIGVLIDPLSEPAQKWSSLLEVNLKSRCYLTRRD